MLKIFTFAHKRPDFIELQLRSFKKNLQEDFEFIVFNNAVFDLGGRENYVSIKLACLRLGVKEIEIQRDKGIETECQNRECGGAIFHPNGEKEIVESPFLDELIADRKHNIRAFNQRHNAEALKKWEEIFNA